MTAMAETGKLIVILAFNRDDEGELQPAFETPEMPGEFATSTAAPLLASMLTLPCHEHVHF